MIEKNDKIADLIKRYPFLKELLIKRNKRFNNLNNPVVFNTVGKFARIQDVARVSGEDIEEFLKFLNEAIEVVNI